LNHGYDGSKPSDRRLALRRPSGASVWADPGGVLPAIDCRVINISEKGAQVVARSGQPLPDRFQLQIEHSRILGDAEVVWRNGAVAGVKFFTR